MTHRAFGLNEGYALKRHALKGQHIPVGAIMLG